MTQRGTSYGRLAATFVLPLTALLSVPAAAAVPHALALAYANSLTNKDAGCAAQIEKDGKIREVTLATGEQIFFVQGPCGCGAQNCTIGAYAAQTDGYRNVLSAVASTFDAKADGTLSMLAGNDAWTYGHDTYRWDGTKYAIASQTTVYGKFSKPTFEPMQFAPGTSSATITGTQIASHFPDQITFVAAKGQTVTATFLKKDAHVSGMALSSYADANDQHEVGTPHDATSYTWTLPVSGTYLLEIDGTDDNHIFGTYTAKITIR